MPTCPSGHTSASTDYCDVCGELMTGAAPAPSPAPVPAAPPPARRPAPTGPAEGGTEPCPVCTAERTGRFCEECGYDFATATQRSGTNETAMLGAPIPAEGGPSGSVRALPSVPSAPSIPTGGRLPSGWTAVVAADRTYYDSVIADSGPDAASAIEFPPYCPVRRYLLVGPQVRIGRRSVSRGLTPEIDLSGPPEDPGVSHVHAVLQAKPDGSWVLIDPGSTNGTSVNGSTEPISVNKEVPVQDGDRIHVGAWTTITLRKD